MSNAPLRNPCISAVPTFMRFASAFESLKVKLSIIWTV